MFEFKQDISREIFFRKYALHGEKTVEEVLKGIAEEIASVEPDDNLKNIWQEYFYQAMISGKFIPAGRILANARPYSRMKNYNNCFTIDLEDSMPGIYGPVSEDAIIGQMGGGVGFNASKLRPKGALISKGGESSGVMSFIEVFDTSAKAIHTGGGRRGAHICILNIDHPDIEEFIEYKKGRENNKLTQFNISVGITDEFMRAVENDEDWDLVFPLMKFESEENCKTKWVKNNFDLQYCIDQGYTVDDTDLILVKVYKTVRAKDLYERMTKQAWWYNEPGALFLDTVEAGNNASHAFKVDRCNPCGEIVMPSYSLCCLSAINLSKLVKNPFTDKAEFDWEEFKNMVRLGVRFLDNVLDATDYPLEKIEKISKAWRRIGLGITGLGDALMKLRIRYGNKESIDFVNEIGNVLAESAYNASVDLALQKGSFPAYDSHIGHSGFITKLSEETQKRIQKSGLRNIGILTTAPTGCLVPESIVSTNDGLLTLEELIPNYKNYEDGTWIPQENLGALNEYGKYEEIRNTFVNGFKPTKKISTKSGINLEGTPNHKFRVLNGASFDWKKLEDLSIGDNIVYKIGGYEKKDNKRLILPNYAKNPNEKDIKLPEEITPEFAFFLGLYNADGSTHNKGIRISLNHLTDEAEAIVELVKNLFGWEAQSIHNGRNCDSIYISSQRLLRFLETNDLIKNKALDINIPKAVRMSSKESILSYLDGYFYGDGSSSKGTMYIDTYSEKNAQQLAIIMRAVGINSSISIYDKSLDENSFSDNLAYRIYWKKYGSIGEERVKRYIRKELKEKVEYLNEYFGEGLFVDEVVSINDSNNYTLDLEVPDGRTYIANSYVSHNTTSLSIGNNCSSGIEPIFSLQYDRTIRQDDDTSKTQTVYDDGWLEFVEHFGYKEGNDLPDYVVVSHDVSIAEGIDIQAALQYWIDHSISKTINMPFETTLEQYKDIFMYSWKQGLKGVTSFHEGASMDGILSTKKETKENWKKIEVLKNSTKRPESLPCDIYDITVNKESVIVLVGKNNDDPYNGAPYEIFYTDNHDDIVDLKKFKQGNIVKISGSEDKASRYDLVIEGKRSKIVLEDLAQAFNDDYATMCRLLSLLMRHQVPLEFIISQMNKVKRFGTFQKAVARVLKYYIKDGENVISHGNCPECDTKMIFKEGCVTCPSCGYSQCG